MYNKARSAIEPFTFSRFREEKIRQQVEASRPARLKIKSNLPAVNQDLALKCMDETDNKRKKTSNLLADDRFKALFNNPDFEVDKNADEYKMLTPVLSRLDKNKTKELKKKVETTMAFEDENEAVKSSDDDLFSEKDEGNESSDDDDRGWQQELKRNYRANRKNQKLKDAEDEETNQNDSDVDDEPSKHSTAAPNLEFKVKNITNRLSK